MNRPIDTSTPIRLEPERLEALHIDREELLRAIETACEAFIDGRRPPWMYLHGPRGSGKSHLIALVKNRLVARDIPGLRLVLVSEDTPLEASAEGLWRRIRGEALEVPWATWSPAEGEPGGPVIAFVEGLDRQLLHLSRIPKSHGAEVRELRHRLQEHPEVFVIATGYGVPEALSGADQPFFGQFDTWSVERLGRSDAESLLDRVMGADDRAPDAASLQRRTALRVLSGGNPRALVTLGQACSGPEPLAVAEGLRVAVQELVTHYQQRFRELSPEGQRVVELLASAPRGITPGELASVLGSSNPSVVLRQLEEMAMVIPQRSGRQTHYLLAEPLFRHWLEYRTVPWAEARISWLGRLMEQVLSKQELADIWWNSPGSDLARSASQVSLSVSLISKAVQDIAQMDAPEAKNRALDRTLEVACDAEGCSWLLVLLLIFGQWTLVNRVPTERPGLEPQAAVRRFLSGLQTSKPNRRKLFGNLLAELADVGMPHPTSQWFLLDAAVSTALSLSEPRGRPWKLTPSQRQLLARLPFFRARYATEGRAPSHPPLLTQSDLDALGFTEWNLDGDRLLLAAHLRRSRPLFVRLLATRMSLPTCNRPDLPAVSTAGLVPSMLASRRSVALTWVRSLVDVDEPSWLQFLTWVASVASEDSADADRDTAVTALTGFAIHAPERYLQLRAVLDRPQDRLLVSDVERLLAQLREREHGPLQTELEYVYRTLVPEEEPGN